ncbi:hypothetical protein THAOC_01065 [Thalassiosira oceanica]|uniref:MYND-type domain-containing protein n=1 Tax=Thalassiosira oceanica TaxID=159749 RepID=K0TJ51_THAOC|nr:hypothetical protein THAOC_01065 [Thalassiosira oceanica]|eukprot:EJK77124.1 hypothetical protein THAOC_01065 [Thalassiosira oceanica]
MSSVLCARVLPLSGALVSLASNLAGLSGGPVRQASLVRLQIDRRVLRLARQAVLEAARPYARVPLQGPGRVPVETDLDVRDAEVVQGEPPDLLRVPVVERPPARPVPLGALPPPAPAEAAPLPPPGEQPAVAPPFHAVVPRVEAAVDEHHRRVGVVTGYVLESPVVDRGVEAPRRLHADVAVELDGRAVGPLGRPDRPAVLDGRRVDDVAAGERRPVVVREEVVEHAVPDPVVSRPVLRVPARDAAAREELAEGQRGGLGEAQLHDRPGEPRRYVGMIPGLPRQGHAAVALEPADPGHELLARDDFSGRRGQRPGQPRESPRRILDILGRGGRGGGSLRRTARGSGVRALCYGRGRRRRLALVGPPGLDVVRGFLRAPRPAEGLRVGRGRLRRSSRRIHDHDAPEELARRQGDQARQKEGGCEPSLPRPPAEPSLPHWPSALPSSELGEPPLHGALRPASEPADASPRHSAAYSGIMSCVPVPATAANKEEVCANCGKEGNDTVKLKNCTACFLVKYCSVDCQKIHRKQHKKACKERAAELKDEKLYGQGHEKPRGGFLPDLSPCNTAANARARQSHRMLHE